MNSTTTLSHPNTSHCASGLEALEARLRQDLQWLCLPARRWVPAREQDGAEVLDTAIIGGGMAGLAVPQRPGN